jgi:nucleoside-diphosphate-sugar epimerase
MTRSFSQFVHADFQRLPLDTLGLREELAGQHLLLTGGTGFFGKWLLALLHRLNQQRAGIEVTVVSRDPGRFLAQHPDLRGCSWLHWLASDVRELRRLPGRPVELIVHAAADTSATAHSEPLTLFESIFDGSRRVLDMAVAEGARRVLFTGSGAQYGALSELGVKENHSGACASHRAASAYAEGKRAQETLGAIYAERHGIDVIMTRCFAFSGPGLPLDAHFAIGNFVRDALFSEAVVLNSSGQAQRSYLHGADLAAWLLVLLLRGKSGEAYNVGSDQALSIAELAGRVVARLAAQKPLRILGRAEESTRSFYVPDIAKARALGLDVWTSLEESVDGMARWAKECGEQG